MAVTISLTEEYKWVALGLLSTNFLLAGQTLLVSRKRKIAQIQYPQLYAEKAEAEASRDALIFNCAQRAHQNTLESLPVIVITTVLSAIHFPHIAAGACAGYVFGKVLYTRAYVQGPEKRNQQGGIIGLLSGYVLLISSAVSVGKLFL